MDVLHYFYRIYSPMSSSQTKLVELSDPSAESNVEDILAQTPPKKKVKLAKQYMCFFFQNGKRRRLVMAI